MKAIVKAQEMKLAQEMATDIEMGMAMSALGNPAKGVSGSKIKPAGRFNINWLDARTLQVSIELKDGSILAHRTNYKNEYDSGAVGYVHVILKNGQTVFNSGKTAKSLGNGYAEKLTELGYNPSELNGYVLYVRAEASTTRPKV